LPQALIPLPVLVPQTAMSQCLWQQEHQQEHHREQQQQSPQQLLCHSCRLQLLQANLCRRQAQRSTALESASHVPGFGSLRAAPMARIAGIATFVLRVS